MDRLRWALLPMPGQTFERSSIAGAASPQGGESTLTTDARLGGFPADTVAEVHTIIDPTTARA